MFFDYGRQYMKISAPLPIVLDSLLEIIDSQLMLLEEFIHCFRNLTLILVDSWLRGKKRMAFTFFND